MPNRDGTGPQGKGKMTGRGMGACQTWWKTWQNVPFGCGQGRRCGKWRRKGMGNRRIDADKETEENIDNE